MSTVVSIGRNIGSDGDRLPEDSWKDYRADVADAVEDAAGPLVFHGDGYGHDPVSGAVEQSFTVVAVESADPHGALAAVLGDLARRYGQECVAMTVGETTFPSAADVDEEAAS